MSEDGTRLGTCERFSSLTIHTEQQSSISMAHVLSREMSEMNDHAPQSMITSLSAIQRLELD